MAPQRLGEDEIEARLGSLPWQREGNAIVRDRDFGDFRAAVAFVERVAEIAEEAGHHPDILIHGWNKVRLTLSTHSVGGLTEADFELAQRLERLE